MQVNKHKQDIQKKTNKLQRKQYYRLPSPDLWIDILEKFKALEFNSVSYYFNWGYHSPKKGVYDFSGVRDIQKALDMAKEVGLHVISRAGPYISAEVASLDFH